MGGCYLKSVRQIAFQMSKHLPDVGLIYELYYTPHESISM